MQNYFQNWHTVILPNIASISVNFMSLLQYLDTLLWILCTWIVRSSRSEELYKKCSQKFHRLYRETSLRIQCRCFPLNFVKSLRTPTLQMFTRGLLLKSRIFTGVSFHKIVGFYYTEYYTEQATLLLWRNFLIYSLENSWTCK